VLEYGNPKIYPMPPVVRLNNPFTFPYNFDVVDLTPIRNDSLGVLLTLSVGETVFISKERFESCSVYFISPNSLHGFRGEALPRQVPYFH
jgi:hypothetical protein